MVDQTLHMRQDVYSGFLRLYGEESDKTIAAALKSELASVLTILFNRRGGRSARHPKMGARLNKT